MNMISFLLVGIVSLTLLSIVSSFFFSRGDTTAQTTNIPAVKLERHERGLNPAQKAHYAADPFVCDGGKTKLYPPQVNDEYCDCEDGSDEPGTSACSNSYFFCQNKGYRIVKIPSSRVADGVCDCCDGSDEYVYNTCFNTCAQQAAAERELLDKMLNDYSRGKAIRDENIARLTQENDENLQKVVTLVASINAKEQSVAQLEEAKSMEAILRDEEAGILRLESRKRAKELLRMNEMNVNDASLFAASLLAATNYDSRAITRAAGSFREESSGVISTSSSQTPDNDNQLHHNIDASGEVNVDADHYDEYGADVSVDEVASSLAEHSEEITIDGPNEVADSVVLASEGSVALKNPNCELLAGHSSPSDIIVTLCNELAPTETGADSVANHLKDFLIYLIDSKNWAVEAQLLGGYQVVHGSFGGAAEFVRDNRVASVDCPESFQPAADKLCGISTALKEIFDGTNALIDNAARPAQEQHRAATTELNDLRRELSSVESKIRDFDANSQNIAFLSTKNECSDVRDAKFTYKVCVMGSVDQTEDGSSHSVSLGHFDSIEETEDGGAIMKFRNGQHCHAFGPRSADVKITCGSSSKVLSASEPSTCFYSFTMESPAACTPKFAAANGLHV